VSNINWFSFTVWAIAVIPHSVAAQVANNPVPTASDWAKLARLPDWSGSWNPSLVRQYEEIEKNPVPWNAGAAEEIARIAADATSGHPHELFENCLPQGMPSWMLITHNALEFLFTPGRVTILGESDGNRIRRIYTDGRQHPHDPDLTFHGRSIGRWEGGTLVVDTIGVLPQTYIATGESLGVPNNGEMHIVEHIHLAGSDILQDDLEITAPRVLKGTWKTSRIFFRQRARKFDIIEGVCLQGSLLSGVDKNGNAIFAPLPEIEKVHVP